MSNIFSGIGTCTRDAEVRYLPSGQAVLTVNVANNQGFGDKQTVMFIRVTVFGKRAEGTFKDFLVKGQQVLFSGELKTNEYKANDGTMKTSLELVANVLDLVGKKSDSPSQGQQPAQPQNAPPRGNQPPQGDNFDAPYDDMNIPF